MQHAVPATYALWLFALQYCKITRDFVVEFPKKHVP